VESLDDGWAWMARLADGRCYWQITLDAGTASLPGKAQLAAYCAERRRGSAQVQAIFDQQAFAPAQVHARSTAILAGSCAGDDWLRVGMRRWRWTRCRAMGFSNRCRRRCRRRW
jgi:hypothetical protein